MRMNIVPKRCLNHKRVFLFIMFIFVFMGLFSAGYQHFCLYGEDTGARYFKNFTPGDYDHQPQNWSILQDNRGIIYVANQGGVLEFDGVSWRIIKIPNWSVRSIVIDDTGGIYVGGNNEIGYLAPGANGTRQYVSLLDYWDENKRDFSVVWKAHITNEGIYFNTTLFLYRLDPKTMHLKEWKPKNQFFASFTYDGELFIRQNNIGLMHMVKDSLELVPGGEIFAAKKIYMMVPYDSRRMLIGTRSHGFYFYDGTKATPFLTEVDDYLIKNQVYHGIRLSSSPGYFALATRRGGLVIMDSHGKVKYLFNKSTGLQSDNVKYVFEDVQGNLWLALEKGVSKIEYGSPFFLYDDRFDLSGVVLAEVNHHGVLYAGTTWGLYVFDSSLKKFRPVPGISSNCWSLRSVDNGILAAASEGVFQLQDGIDEVRRIIDDTSFILQPSQRDKRRIWVGTRRGLLSLYRQSKDSLWHEEYRFKDIDREIRTIIEDRKGNVWLGLTSEGIIKVEFTGDMSQPAVTRYDTSHGLPDAEVRVFKAAGHVVFTTEMGIYRFDETKEAFIPDMTLGNQFAGGEKSTAVFQIAEDKNNNIWFHSLSRNFLAVPDAEGKFVIHTKPLSRIPHAQVNAVYPDPDGVSVWFGGTDGLIRYDSTIEKKCKTKYSTLIRDLLINGVSLLYDNKKYQYKIYNRKKTDALIPVIAYKERNLRFIYAASFYEAEHETQYRYILKGYDEDWSSWSTKTQIDYTNLDSGRYTFQVQAKNVYGDLGGEAVFKFKVLPPWYKTWWAFVIYAFLFFGVIFLAVRWRSSKLEQDKQRLEQVVKERTNEVYQKNELLEEQSQKLKEMDRVKSRFFANISHEFRTPLTLIMGPMEQMLAKKRDRQEENQLSMMLRNSNRLLHLINQLLDLSRFDSGKMKLQYVCQNIVSFVKGIAASFQVLSQQKRLDLVFEAETEEIALYFDPGKMEEAITNLLINAVKFTPAGGKIAVTIARERPVEDNGVPYLKISVQDTGVGMPKEQLVHIFDRFYQASSSRENDRKGTGIGLSLTKEIVTLHHGQIDVHSTEGQGTEFAIRLPMGKDHLKPNEIADSSPVSLRPGKHAEAAVDYLKPEQEKEDSEIEGAGTNGSIEPDKEHQPGEQEKHVILVVEDHADVRKYIRASLEPEYTVIEAKDGKEGIDKAGEIIPDLIISDIMMPEVDGYELCKMIKTDIVTSHIPVILLTAKASEESMVLGLETGADDYITKPFSTKILTVRIKNLIELRRQLQMKIQRQKMLLPAEINVSSIDETFLKELHGIVEKNLGDPDFNIDRLCEKLYMGRTSLFKKVQALTGETPNQFIQSYRLQRAAQLLKANFGNVTEVAFEVGFSNSAYFTKCFKEKFYQLPSTFLAAEGSSGPNH
jgi:signal transduction histidine kinase/CheY-like chemotaxis protein/streptogramin lyase